MSKIDGLKDLLKQEEKQFNAKRSKMMNKLNSKRKELELAQLKFKEKDQERRLGNLKLRELRRIIKQHKLKPLLGTKKEDTIAGNSGRNRSLGINQSHPSISHTYDAQYGNNATDIAKENETKYGYKIKLAKVEWRHKGKRLHQSSVDLRDKTPQKYCLKSKGKSSPTTAERLKKRIPQSKFRSLKNYSCKKGLS